MTQDMDHQEHAAKALPEAQRVEYLVAVASVVYADKEVAEAELLVLRTLADVLDVHGAALDRVIAAAQRPDLAAVDKIVSSFRETPVAYALLTDAILVAFADGKLAPGETEEIAEFADALGIKTAQAALVGRYVEQVIVGADDNSLSKALSEGLADAASHVHPPRGVKWLYRKLSNK